MDLGLSENLKFVSDTGSDSSDRPSLYLISDYGTDAVTAYSSYENYTYESFSRVAANLLSEITRLKNMQRKSGLPEIRDHDFNRNVLEAKKPVLVDFSAAWCGPCRRQEPILKELSKEYRTRISVYSYDIIDWDFESAIKEKYSIGSIQRMILFKDGKIFKDLSGFKSKEELNSIFDEALL